MDPSGSRAADRALDHVDERGDVVVGHRLALENAFDELFVGRRRPVAAGHRILRRDYSERGVCLGRQEFDLEPAAESHGV